MNLPPGAIEPEFHAPLFAVLVCAVLSSFVHVTLPPTATVMGFGAYAVVVNVVAPVTIDTGDPDVFGVGEGPDGDEDDPQPIDTHTTAAASARRNLMPVSFGMVLPQISCLPRIRPFTPQVHAKRRLRCDAPRARP